MVSSENKDRMKFRSRLLSILEIIDTALNGSVELLQHLYDEDLEVAHILLNDLQQVVLAVSSAQTLILERIQRGNPTEQLENIMDTLSGIENALSEDDLLYAKHLTEYQLLPFFRLLKEAFYFWGCIYPDQTRMAQYYSHEFAEHYRSPYYLPGEPCRYQLSIVVAGYNHVDVTKRCIEHVLRYADLKKLNAELVLIDHGSSDETLEFLRSIPEAKVIHFKHNVRMYMFAAIPLVCEGEFINFISNDILVTQNWAENLITCIKSDERIAAAVPMTPNISNLQMLSVPTSDPEKFVQWANQFNRSDPALWSDRARLMPPTGVYRMSALYKLGLADPYFYSMEFWDDDFSLRARRAGYRQILCEDTACYHFGSVTGRDAQKKEGTLQYGRELFQKKNHVDAWGTGFCHDYSGVQVVKQSIEKAKQIKLLGIDCGFGDTPLQIRNEFRHVNGDVTLYNLTMQREYAPDLESLSDHFQLSNMPIQDAISSSFLGQQFDCIYVGRDAGEYDHVEEMLAELQKRLALGGCCVFRAENPWYVLNLNAFLQGSLPHSYVRWIGLDVLCSAAERVFSSVQVISVRQEIQKMELFARKYFPEQNKTFIDQLSIRYYYFVCRR